MDLSDSPDPPQLSFTARLFGHHRAHILVTPPRHAQPNAASPESEAIPDSDPGLDPYSSPVRGRTKAQRHAHRAEKDAVKMAVIQEEKEADLLAIQRAGYDRILEQMEAEEVHFGELLEYVFNPEYKQGYFRWHRFFASQGRASRILDWWTSKANSKKARDEVSQWAYNFTVKASAREARNVTKSKTLQTRGKTIDEELVLSFTFDRLRESLEDTLAPVTMRILRAFSTSGRPHVKARTDRTNTVCIYYP